MASLVELTGSGVHPVDPYRFWHVKTMFIGQGLSFIQFYC